MKNRIASSELHPRSREQNYPVSSYCLLVCLLYVCIRCDAATKVNSSFAASQPHHMFLLCLCWVTNPCTAITVQKHASNHDCGGYKRLGLHTQDTPPPIYLRMNLRSDFRQNIGDTHGKTMAASRTFQLELSVDESLCV